MVHHYGSLLVRPFFSPAGAPVLFPSAAKRFSRDEANSGPPAVRKLMWKEPPPPLNLQAMPGDLLDRIVECLFSIWPKATRVERVSQELRATSTRVRDGMRRAWWTGTGPPLQPLVVEPLIPVSIPRNALSVGGADVGDLHLLVSAGSWLNNFAIIFVLRATLPDAYLNPFPLADELVAPQYPHGGTKVLFPELVRLCLVAGDGHSLAQQHLKRPPHGFDVFVQLPSAPPRSTDTLITPLPGLPERRRLLPPVWSASSNSTSSSAVASSFALASSTSTDSSLWALTRAIRPPFVPRSW